MSAACCGLGSITASTCPLRTQSPSWNSTCCSGPVICARTTALLLAVTVPSAESCWGASPRTTGATPTATAPLRPPPLPPDAADAAPSAPEAAARCIHHQPPPATRDSAATTAAIEKREKRLAATVSAMKRFLKNRSSRPFRTKCGPGAPSGHPSTPATRGVGTRRHHKVPHPCAHRAGHALSSFSASPIAGRRLRWLKVLPASGRQHLRMAVKTLYSVLS